MASGTALRGGPRTRALLLLLSVFLAGASWLTGPVAVLAAANFSRSVTFPRSVETGWTQLFNLNGGTCSSGTTAAVGPPAPGALEGPADATPQVRSLTGSGTGTYCDISDGANMSPKWAWSTQDRDTSATSAGVRYNDTQWGGSLRVQATYGPNDTSGQKRLNIQWFTCSFFVSGGPTCGFGGGDILRTDILCTSPAGTVSSTNTACDVIVPAAPSAARAFKFTTSTTGGSNNTVRMTEFILLAEPGDHTLGGDCGGVGTLAWGASGLTSSTHSAWGDWYDGVFLGCHFSKIGLFDYDPPEALATGDTLAVGVQVASEGTSNCRVSAQWLPSAAVLIPVTDYKGTNPGGATGPGAVIVKEDAPSGTTSLRLSFSSRCIVQAVWIANVEGTSDDGTCSTDDPCNAPITGDDPGNIFNDCDAPGNPLDVPGWLSFGACIVAAGFANTLTAIWSIPGAVVNGELGDLSGILDPLGDILTTLFVPVELGDDWADFIDTVGGKVPFGWFDQIVGSIADGLDAPAADVGPLAFDIGDTTVDIDEGIIAATAAVAPFRGLLAAGVMLVGGLGCLRWIMASVGVSPGGGSAQ